MVKFKTKTEFPVYDIRQQEIGRFILRFIVNSITADNNGITYSGFYFYKNADDKDVVIDSFSFPKSWDIISQAETELSPLQGQHLFPLFKQRIVEFTYIQQQLESGTNWGTIATDWIEDND